MGVHFRGNNPGRHAVHRDARGAQLLGQSPCEADHCGLCGGIGHLAGAAHLPPHGGHGDDPPRLAVDEVGQGGPDGVKHAVHVDGKHPPPVVIGQIAKQFLLCNAGIAYQNVKLTKFIQHIVNHSSHLDRIGHVCLHRPASNLRRQGLRLGLGTVVVDNHLTAPGGKAPGGCRADAPASAGDQDHLLLHHPLPFSQSMHSGCQAAAWAL